MLYIEAPNISPLKVICMEINKFVCRRNEGNLAVTKGMVLTLNKISVHIALP